MAFSTQKTKTMKPKIWSLIVITILILAMISFFFIFQENKLNPTIAGIPFIFWTGFLVTTLVVVLTYLASRFFPYDEKGTK